MIKNIVFDVGNVLVKYDPDGYLKSLGFDEKTQRAVNAAMFESPLWDESDRGVLSPDELLAGFIANNPAYEAQIRRARERVGDTIELMPYAVDWVKDLKSRGFRLYILSNYAEYTFGQTEHKMKFLPFMDETVFSWQCKMIKPEREIYEYLFSKYDLVPSECVFLDDRAVNVEAARETGMNAILFKNYEQGSRELDALIEKSME